MQIKWYQVLFALSFNWFSFPVFALLWLDWRVEKQTCGRKVWFPDFHFLLDASGARGAVLCLFGLCLVTASF